MCIKRQSLLFLDRGVFQKITSSCKDYSFYKGPETLGNQCQAVGLKGSGMVSNSLICVPHWTIKSAMSLTQTSRSLNTKTRCQSTNLEDAPQPLSNCQFHPSFTCLSSLHDSVMSLHSKHLTHSDLNNLSSQTVNAAFPAGQETSQRTAKGPFHY